jgi:hypothetical protein
MQKKQNSKISIQRKKMPFEFLTRLKEIITSAAFALKVRK